LRFAQFDQKKQPLLQKVTKENEGEFSHKKHVRLRQRLRRDKKKARTMAG